MMARVDEVLSQGEDIRTLALTSERALLRACMQADEPSLLMVAMAASTEDLRARLALAGASFEDDQGGRS
jgi:hypothetical protein